MRNDFYDFQKLNQANLNSAVKAFGDWNKSVTEIATELGAYSKRTFDDGTETFDRLVSAKSVKQALEIQAEFATRSVEDYVKQMARIGTLYSDIAQAAYQPFDAVLTSMDTPKRIEHKGRSRNGRGDA